MRVIFVAPGEMLRMSGALGPLQASGLAGSLTWALKAAPNGTAVELSYSVGGFFPGGFEKIAPAVNAVLEEQLRRFKLFCRDRQTVIGPRRIPYARGGVVIPMLRAAAAAGGGATYRGSS